MSAMPAEAEPRRAPAAPGLTVLSPTVLSPTVLSPTVLSPTALSPTALSPTALSPATVRPRPAAPAPRVIVLARRPAGLRPRPAGLRMRPVVTRTHPVGVRSCSSIPHPSIPHPLAPAAEQPAAAAEQPAAAAEQPAAAVPELIQQPALSLPARAPGRLRLTRRGRIVLTLGAAAAASLTWLAAASGAQAAGHGVSLGATGQSASRIVVQPGQTLWSIATQADPQADPRLVVQRIMAANKLAGGSIVAGQRLLVPHL